MNQPISPLPRLTIEEVAKKFDHWRKARKRTALIPDELWEAAASLHERYSANVISRRLHISHTGLKEKIREYKEKYSSSGGMGINFLELQTMPFNDPFECEITMESPSGAKMKISLKGRTEIDFLELGRVFWSNYR